LFYGKRRSEVPKKRTGVDGKRFVVHADEKLTAFVELEAATRSASQPWQGGKSGLLKLSELYRAEFPVVPA
jgi:hypothetical protein